MIHFRGLGVAVLVIGALFARPASAQIRGASSSLVHVVSVTVPARVKVKVSSISMMPARTTAAEVKVTTGSALAVSVDSNKAWVLSVSAPAAGSPRGSSLQWSGTHTNTTVVVRAGKPAGASASTVPVILTVSAP